VCFDELIGEALDCHLLEQFLAVYFVKGLLKIYEENECALSICYFDFVCPVLGFSCFGSLDQVQEVLEVMARALALHEASLRLVNKAFADDMFVQSGVHDMLIYLGELRRDGDGSNVSFCWPLRAVL